MFSKQSAYQSAGEVTRYPLGSVRSWLYSSCYRETITTLIEKAHFVFFPYVPGCDSQLEFRQVRWGGGDDFDFATSPGLGRPQNDQNVCRRSVCRKGLVLPDGRRAALFRRKNENGPVVQRAPRSRRG